MDTDTEGIDPSFWFRPLGIGTEYATHVYLPEVAEYTSFATLLLLLLLLLLVDPDQRVIVCGARVAVEYEETGVNRRSFG